MYKNIGWMSVKFTLETAKEFEIGYAPVDGFALVKFLSAKKFSEIALQKSGLFREGKAKAA